MTTLADLKPGTSATVSGFAGTDPIAARLMQMGMLDGIEVTVVRRAPAGDPIEVAFGGTRMSLRNREARLVLVTTV